jgi:putative transcriptional regulator
MRERGDKTVWLAGSLLLAHPKLRDPNFARTVVLMSLHNAEGAMGVVLNRPLDKTLSDLGPDSAAASWRVCRCIVEVRSIPSSSSSSLWQTTTVDGTFKLYFGSTRRSSSS